VQATIPWQQVAGVRVRASIRRALLLYGPHPEVTVTGISGVRLLEFSERSSRTILTSRRITRELCKAALAAVAARATSLSGSPEPRTNRS
jgi:hypothetical protein